MPALPGVPVAAVARPVPALPEVRPKAISGLGLLALSPPPAPAPDSNAKPDEPMPAAPALLAPLAPVTRALPEAAGSRDPPTSASAQPPSSRTMSRPLPPIASSAAAPPSPSVRTAVCACLGPEVVAEMTSLEAALGLPRNGAPFDEYFKRFDLTAHLMEVSSIDLGRAGVSEPNSASS